MVLKDLLDGCKRMLRVRKADYEYRTMAICPREVSDEEVERLERKIVVLSETISVIQKAHDEYLENNKKPYTC